MSGMGGDGFIMVYRKDTDTLEVSNAPARHLTLPPETDTCPRVTYEGHYVCVGAWAGQ